MTTELNVNAKIIGGAIVLLAAVYWWLVARHSNATTPVLDIFYAFTFRLFRFADVLWTIGGATLLYRGIEEARET